MTNLIFYQYKTPDWDNYPFMELKDFLKDSYRAYIETSSRDGLISFRNVGKYSPFKKDKTVKVKPGQWVIIKDGEFYLDLDYLETVPT